MNEEYCSFEVAKLLKEKGYENEYTYAYYTSEGELKFLQCFGDASEYFAEENSCIDAPTHSQARAFLRTKYNVHIEIRYNRFGDIYRYVIIHSPENLDDISSHPAYYNSYEEAEESALKEVLKGFSWLWK